MQLGQAEDAEAMPQCLSQTTQQWYTTHNLGSHSQELLISDLAAMVQQVGEEFHDQRQCLPIAEGAGHSGLGDTGPDPRDIGGLESLEPHHFFGAQWP